MKQTWRRPGSQTSGGPHRARESHEKPPQGQPPGPTQKRAEEGPEGDHPAATMQTSQGGVAASPQVHAGSRPHQSRTGPGPGDPRAPTPSRGPAKARGARPRQATARERASTHPSIPPRSEKPPTHRRPGASSTGRGVRGNQHQTPELNPLHSGVETGKDHPGTPQQQRRPPAPDPDRMASSSSPAPSPGQRTETTGGTPVAPNLPRAGGPGPSRPGPTAARGGRNRGTPQQRDKNYPHPIQFSQLPDYRRTIDTQSWILTDGKQRPYQLKRPPDPPTRQRPPHQGRAQAACHQPSLPGGTPTRTQAPQAPAGIPARPPQQRRMQPPENNNTQEPPTPPSRPGPQPPSAEPPKKPTPRELPDAPSPYGPSHGDNKNQRPGQNR
ncbi:hypothetical protein M9458_051902 [Cirrhinus mrigala]|uniref:Uncharacterized protein n=1 Tax=Cirrhinus mrigala TaxID=683832 RepID=A0ABD0MQD3_CIRMR